MQRKYKFEFVGKTLLFPTEKTLVIGDLHLGYGEMLRQKGLEISLNQFEEMVKELENTLRYVKTRYGKIKRIIFLGDVKHHFGFLASEKEEMKKLISFLKKQGLDDNQIIFIRGNHEKNEKSGRYCDYYLLKDIAFVHGHREFLEIYDKNINIIIMGHIHPTITLSDKIKLKKEKYKCFLVGRHRKKDFVVLPSFLGFTEGVSLSEFSDERAGRYDFSIVPNKELENFEVFVCQEIGDSALHFGKLKDI